MTEEPLDRVEFDEQATTLLDIAITKAHAYAQEYNTHTGMVVDKDGHAY